MTISATTQGLRPGVTTSSNRPVTPFEGQQIYETDTDKVLVYNGTAWKQVPTAATAGAVLQVVAGTPTNTQATFTSSTPATTGITATITPSSTSSKILISASVGGCNKQTNDTGLDLWIYRNGSQLIKTGANIGSVSSASQTNSHASVLYLDSPATTSATTYAIFGASTANNIYALTQHQSAYSMIILSEVSA